MIRTISLAIAGISFISSIASAGSFTVVTTPDQETAIQQAMHAKRGMFAGQNEQQLVQLMLNRGIKSYQMFLNRLGRKTPPVVPEPAAQ